MALLKRSFALIALVPVALFLNACGPAAVASPSSGQEVLDRMVEAMAGVESYRFEGTREHHEVQGDVGIDETSTFEGEHGPNESYFVSARSQASYGHGEPYVLETLAVDGVVLQRTVEGPRLEDGETGPWEESLYHPFGKPDETPPIEMAGRIAVTSYADQTEAVQGSEAVYTVKGTAERLPVAEGVTPVTWEVDLVISADTYRLLEIATRTEREEVSGGVAISSETTTTHRLFDFGADIEIELPAEYAHEYYAVYVFSMEGDVDVERLREEAPDALNALGSHSMSVRVEPDEVRVRLIGDTFPPEQVEAGLENAFPNVQFTLTEYTPPYEPDQTPDDTHAAASVVMTTFRHE